MKRRQLPEEFSPDDWGAFAGELQGESERATVIVAAAFLDDLLATLMATFLIDDSEAAEQLLMRPFSPLGSFSARITTAYLLGLIGRMERNDLGVIKDIRNRFAHERAGLRLGDASITPLLHRLQLSSIVPETIRNAMSTDPRQVFINHASMLASFLESRLRTMPTRLQQPRQIVIVEP